MTARAESRRSTGVEPDRRPTDADAIDHRRRSGPARGGRASGPSSCPGTSPSSWTATAAGPRTGACPGSSATAGGSRASASVVEEGCRLGLDQLTLYCLSVENWKRPPRELKFLLRLLRHFLVVEREELMEQNVRLTMIGRREGLPARRARASSTGRSRQTAGNAGMTLCLAVNYGGRTEIADAARRLAEDVRAGRLDPDQVDEATLRLVPLTRPGCPTPTS